MHPRTPGNALLHRADRYAWLLRVGCLWGAVLVLSELLRAVFRGGGTTADFALFYQTIERAREHLPLYGSLTANGRVWLAGPNYNPPHFYLVVVPFALLPFAAGFVLWTITGILGALYIAGRVIRTLSAAVVDSGRLLAAGLILANATLASTLRSGQLSLVLALPVSLAWIAAREGRWVAAGLWIGLAASIKPFLLIVAAYFLVSRRWRALVAMTAAGLGAVAVGAAVFGPNTYLQWLDVFQARRMDAHFLNASFPGFVARTVGAHGARAAQVVAGVGVLLTVVVAARSRQIDKSWLLLMAGALLWSPLGWVYYGWLLMPPIVALAINGRLPLLAWGWILLWLWPPYTPSFATARPEVASTIGSVYFWGLLLLWIAAIQPDAEPPKSGSPDT